MKTQNIFGDISVKKTAEKFEVEAYRSDMEEIEKYLSFKKQSLGGEVIFADVLNRLVRALQLDPEYSVVKGTETAPQSKAKRTRMEKTFDTTEAATLS